MLKVNWNTIKIECFIHILFSSTVPILFYEKIFANISLITYDKAYCRLLIIIKGVTIDKNWLYISQVRRLYLHGLKTSHSLRDQVPYWVLLILKIS